MREPQSSHRNHTEWCAVMQPVVLGLVGLILGCSSDEPAGRDHRPAGDAAEEASRANDGGDAARPMPVEYPTLECDPLVPSYCSFPFPSNVFTQADDESPTGRRVALAQASLPIATGGAITLPERFNESDGFSPGAAILAHFPGMTAAGLAQAAAPEQSLEPQSLTVLLDTETGERVAHFAELDRSGSDDRERALLIRPVVRLKDAHRYVVAIRGLRSDSGMLQPAPAFRALRDEEPFEEDASIDLRRALYVDIFARLARAGVPRDDLLLAWDFTTASRENNTSRLLHMRDEALAMLEVGGPEYTIQNVDSDFDPENIAFKIDVLMKAPLYMETPEPQSNLVFGEDGHPEPNATRPNYEIPVEILIPVSARDAPAKLIQYGHGLLGSRSQIESGHFRTFMNSYNYAFFAVDLVGMSEEDLIPIAGILAEGELHRLSTMFDRLHQGMLNSLLAMRMMGTSFASDATYGAMIDPSQRFYHGISQGGIFGGVYMAVTTDVERGVLGVMGQPYNLLLNRSVDFDPFFAVLEQAFPSSLDQQFGLVLVQMLWDRLEPNGYTPYIREKTLPGTPPHEVLMRAALGDHQVSNVGARIMARSVGAKHLDSGLGGIFGLETVTELQSGSAYVEYDFGLPQDPSCNLPQRLCEDPHGKLRSQEAARQQMHRFLTTGEAVNFCENGICDYSSLSGCAGGETNAAACN